MADVFFILTILFACIIFVLIVAIICMVIYSKNNNQQSQQKTINDISGWQLYMLKNCGYCTKQLAELKGFNTFAEYERGNPVPIVNNIQGELYPRDKISGFPFWYNSNTGETKSGKQDICSLNPRPQTANCSS
jgi:hypothetical protein